MQRQKKPQGQSLVLLVFAIIGLLGMLGLAVDGGRAYVEKRRAQNASDTAALTAALVLAQAPNPSSLDAQRNARSAAIARIQNNGYTLLPANSSTETFDGTTYQYTLDTDTAHLVFTIEKQDYYYITVELQSTIPPALIQLVYDGDIQVSATAQTRVRRYNPFANFAIGTLGRDDCPGLKISGNNITIVNSGGVFVNAGCPTALVLGGSINVNASQGIQVVGEVKVNGNPDFSPPPDTGVPPIEVPTWPTPDCDYHYNASNLPHNLTPGIYCVYGNLKMQGNYTGHGVVLYLVNGDFTINAGATVDLSAPTNGPWKGMLIYMAPDNDGLLTINGGATFTLKGTIYAPAPPRTGGEKCNVAGNSDSSIVGQLLCYSAELTGTSDWTITYDPNYTYTPPIIELTQ